MSLNPDPERVAEALRVSIGLLRRRLRQPSEGGELTLPQTAALKRLDLGGPMTPTALAKLEEISPQSMGATLGALQEQGLIARAPDPRDGRQTIVSLTKAGRSELQSRRNARTQLLAKALAGRFTQRELKQLMAAAPLLERLAQSI
jgi:DNA-binding MarR family transcriptional regulator